MKKLFLSMLAVATTFCCTSLNAQIELRGSGGFYRIEGETDLLVSLDARYYATEQIAFGLSYSWLKSPDDVSQSMFGIGGEYYFSDSEFQPYAGLSLGLLRFSGEVDMGPFGGSMSFSTSELYVSPRGGVRYAVSDEIGVFGEVGYARILGDLSGNMITGGVGLSFRF